MDNYEYVEKLYKKEKELYKICYYFGLNEEDSKDMIQDLYFKLMIFNNIDRYIIDNEPNMYIIFVILKNQIYHFRLEDEKFRYDEIGCIELVENGIDIEEEMIKDKEYKDFCFNLFNSLNEKMKNIDRFLKNEEDIYWFDAMIFDKYIRGGHTMRSLKNETNISLNVIFTSIKNIKMKLCLDKNKIKLLTYYIKNKQI